MLPLTLSLLLLSPTPQQPATSAAPAELYRFVLVQAAPGRLLELIELYKGRLPVIAEGGDEAPYIVRHSQGDRWDLLVIYPSGTFTSYYSAERVRRRTAAAEKSGVSNADFARRFYDLVSWHEDVYVEGPPLPVFREYVKDLGLVHFEMFQALAGKRGALIEERRMESAFNIARAAWSAHLHARAGSRVGRHHARRLSRLAPLRGVGDDPAGGDGGSREEGGVRERGRHRALYAFADLPAPRHARHAGQVTRERHIRDMARQKR